jgi:chromosome segregation ATPase
MNNRQFLGNPQPDEEPGQEEHSQGDLDRVREIILGPDQTRGRLRRAETDRLRDILFGAQIEDYERRFSDLRREAEHLKGDLSQAQERLAELEKSQLRRFDQLELDLRRVSDELGREQERQRGRDVLIQQIAAQVRQHEELITGTSASVVDLKKTQTNHELEIRSAKSDLVDVRDRIEQRSQALRRDIRHSEDTLRAELRRITDRLESQKTDRRALASMLIEIATRLETGNTVTGILEGLSDSKE